METGGRKDMRLDARAADSSICGCDRTVEDEDGSEEGVGGLVKGQLLKRQVRR